MVGSSLPKRQELEVASTGLRRIHGLISSLCLGVILFSGGISWGELCSPFV